MKGMSKGQRNQIRSQLLACASWNEEQNLYAMRVNDDKAAGRFWMQAKHLRNVAATIR